MLKDLLCFQRTSSNPGSIPSLRLTQVPFTAFEEIQAVFIGMGLHTSQNTSF